MDSSNGSIFWVWKVSPFGNPRILRLFAPPRGLSQLVTSFFGSQCQGIPLVLLLAWTLFFFHIFRYVHELRKSVILQICNFITLTCLERPLIVLKITFKFLSVYWFAFSYSLFNVRFFGYLWIPTKRYFKRNILSLAFISLVGSSRFELPTSRLSGARSNHLSYEPIVLSRFWWRWRDSNPRPPACKAGALPTELHPHIALQKIKFSLSSSQETIIIYLIIPSKLNNVAFYQALLTIEVRNLVKSSIFSLERRWSSRTFRYGYLVTT